MITYKYEVHLQKSSLYDFLYIHEFDPWLLNSIKKLHPTGNRSLLEFIMQLHTGESVVEATPKWDWARRKTFSQRILRDLACALILSRQSDPAFEPYGEGKKAAVDTMQRALELDGYVYKDGLLLLPEESILDEREEEGVLEALMGKVCLPDTATLKHHLARSAEHYRDARWDDSISNSRKVLEGVLEQGAERYSIAATGKKLPSHIAGRPVGIRQYLESNSILEKKEREAIDKVYGLLSQTGGHPYIAEKDQARLMRHLALTFAQFVLLRLDGALLDLSAKTP